MFDQQYIVTGSQMVWEDEAHRLWRVTLMPAYAFKSTADANGRPADVEVLIRMALADPAPCSPGDKFRCQLTSV